MSNSQAWIGKWHRDKYRRGVYWRRRQDIDGKRTTDRVENRGKRGWVVFIDGIGGNSYFPTRMEATGALDGYVKKLREPVKDEPKQDSENTKCDGCNGTGVYYGHGHVENGVFKGKTGKCFRCGGKGHQDAEDRVRNSNYDNYIRRIPV
jgi:hypothetical protein